MYKVVGRGLRYLDISRLETSFSSNYVQLHYEDLTSGFIIKSKIMNLIRDFCEYKLLVFVAFYANRDLRYFI